LRQSLELLQQEQASLFSGSLADWLQSGGDKNRQ
jgi:membrane protein